ncbi:MAG: MarR family transcriptional regulator, transcriptional regulator for hemolysin [Gammaproteobacteria bacterium]|nr:MarR family transcriptional regulator, transcriptional regulator for hemolysin [Gammaproteobacteria bacterium]
MARILDREVRFAFLIHDVSRLRRVMFDRIVRGLGTSRSQWWVLAFLSRDDGSPQTNLADELDVGKVALGGLIDRLEEAGMVQRRPDPIDRRVKRVFLTKEGRKLVSQNKELDKSVNETTLQGVSEADFEITMRTLDKMKTNLLAAMGGTASSEDADTAAGSAQAK